MEKMAATPLAKYSKITVMVGYIALAISAYFAWESQSFVNEGVAVQGTILKYYKNYSKESGTRYYAVIGYTKLDGGHGEYKSSRRGRVGSVGSAVSVLIKPNGDMIVDDFWILWLLPISLSFAGLMIIFVVSAIGNARERAMMRGIDVDALAAQEQADRNQRHREKMEENPDQMKKAIWLAAAAILIATIVTILWVISQWPE